MFLMVDRMDFAYWLQGEREKAGWSQSDLSRFSGLNRAVINKVESGTKPMPETLTAIAKAFNFPPDYVFEKAGILPPKSDLSPIKRAAIHAIESATDDDVEFINKWLTDRNEHGRKLTLQTRLK
jgi:transcriptional regulator with XRE-family HTH domain